MFEHLHVIYTGFDGRIKADNFRRQIMAVTTVWESWMVFNNHNVEAWVQTFLGRVETDKQEIVELVEQVVEKPVEKKSRWKSVAETSGKEAVDVESFAPVSLNALDEDIDVIQVEDVEGESMKDVDGLPIDEDVDGEPMDDVDVDGLPMDDEDVDGVPMDEEDYDGMPMDEHELQQDQEISVHNSPGSVLPSHEVVPTPEKSDHQAQSQQAPEQKTSAPDVPIQETSAQVQIEKTPAREAQRPAPNVSPSPPTPLQKRRRMKAADMFE